MTKPSHQPRSPAFLIWRSNLAQRAKRLLTEKSRASFRGPHQRFALVALTLAFLLAGIAAPAAAQRRSLLKDSPKVKAAFRAVVDETRNSVVEVWCPGEDDEPVQVALGTIVGTDGWILTKASEIHGEITCKVPGKGQHSAKLVGVNNEHDLAMLKIDADELPAVKWNPAKTYSAGKWVVAAGSQQDPLAVGVVSVPRRKIPGFGLLGVRLGPVDRRPPQEKEEEKRPPAEGAVVDRVNKDSGADRAGIKPGDVITHVDGKRTPSNIALVQTIRRYGPGATIKVTLQRGDEKIEVAAVLQSPPPTYQDLLSRQPLSLRRTGFPSAFQHDTVLRREQCGGPLLGLDGRVMGISIARAGRVISYAIPGDVVLTLLDDLKSGKLAPPETVATVSRKSEPAEPRESP